MQSLECMRLRLCILEPYSTYAVIQGSNTGRLMSIEMQWVDSYLRGIALVPGPSDNDDV